MKRLFACLAILLPASVFAECIATAYRTGTAIPSYLIQSVERLEPYWNNYKAQYPMSAWLRCVSGNRTPACSLHNLCLVSVVARAQEDAFGVAGAEKLVLQQPCSDLAVGDSFRMYVYQYCVELFGQDPDLFSSLPFRHAHVTEHERYGEE